ncbi:MAG: PQQ-dependent sugar dehydrogenase [Chitinivibrionales bacterium]|nr:PQQ-dependent sugar dehydrogenase [Chitinivibrionales bacterium]
MLYLLNMLRRRTVFCTFMMVAVSSYAARAQLDTATIVSNLDTPWEILWGPDDWIWFTERKGRISRVHPSTGELKILIDRIPDVHEQSESGLLGMALHPAFEAIPHVFVVYTYRPSGSIVEKLVRFTYDGDTLSDPHIILDNIRGAPNHNGSRLLFLPDTTLLMTTGDVTNQNLALDVHSLEGKILRLNPKGSIPADNPSSASLIWSYGHRNAQGLVRLPDGKIYSSEHGPNNDDEVNLILKAGNYGWPQVHGYCDRSSEMTYCNQNTVVEPVAAWTPTLAVAGLDYYHHDAIPSLKNSLIMVTLKERDIRALKLNSARTQVVSQQTYFDNAWGRLRDLCISPDGRIYIAVSNQDGRGQPEPGDDRIVELSSGAVGIDYHIRRDLAGTPVGYRHVYPALKTGTALLFNIRGRKIPAHFISQAPHKVRGIAVALTAGNRSFLMPY